MDQPGVIPLAEVFAAANELRSLGLIEEWALGGALAGIYYVEPFTTYDADLFFIPSDTGLTAGIPAIYAHLKAQGWQVEAEHLLCRGFPVQWLAGHGLTEEAVRQAATMELSGISGRVFRAEHLVAIAASVGRLKDRARIEQMFEQATLDRPLLDDILSSHHLTLPKP
jgi:hypothetical protein